MSIQIAVSQVLNGCLAVVLLDEAEVFLQERSLTDLGRNALVSGMSLLLIHHGGYLITSKVFLRVLEYHDG